RAPLALGQVRPPALPVCGAVLGFLESQLFPCHGLPSAQGLDTRSESGGARRYGVAWAPRGFGAAPDRSDLATAAAPRSAVRGSSTRCTGIEAIISPIRPLSRKAVTNVPSSILGRILGAIRP